MEIEADPATRRALVSERVEGSFATAFRQTVLTRYEQRAYALRAEGGTLTADRLSEIWFEENAKYYGDAVLLPERYRLGWSYIPHFISHALLHLRLRLRAPDDAGALRALPRARAPPFGDATSGSWRRAGRRRRPSCSAAPGRGPGGPGRLGARVPRDGADGGGRRGRLSPPALGRAGARGPGAALPLRGLLGGLERVERLLDLLGQLADRVERAAALGARASGGRGRWWASLHTATVRWPRSQRYTLAWRPAAGPTGTGMASSSELLLGGRDVAGRSRHRRPPRVRAAGSSAPAPRSRRPRLARPRAQPQGSPRRPAPRPSLGGLASDSLMRAPSTAADPTRIARARVPVARPARTRGPRPPAQAVEVRHRAVEAHDARGRAAPARATGGTRRSSRAHPQDAGQALELLGGGRRARPGRRAGAGGCG